MSLKKLQLSSTLFPKNGIYITKNDKKINTPRDFPISFGY